MKHFIYVLMLIPALLSAQNKTFTGTVIDEVSLLPVPIVTVSAPGTNVITVSNEEGKFRISVPVEVSELQFTHLNYQPVTTSLAGQSELSIIMKPTDFVLDEVVVTDRPVNEILLDVMSASKKKLEKSLLMNTYYREFVKLNGDYTKFSDGLLDYNVKSKKGSSDLYVRQSRGFQLTDPIGENSKTVQDALYLFDVRDAISDGYNFKKIQQILKSDVYDYELRMKTDAQGKSLEVVNIKPKEGTKYAAYNASVTYDPATKLILDLEYSMSDKYMMYAKEVNVLIMKFTMYEDARKSMFRLDGDKYIMTYNKNKMRFHLKMGKRLNDTFEFMSDLVTLDYKEGEFDLNRKQRHKERSLFAAGTKFTEEYWKSANIMLLTDAEEKVLQSLK